MGHRARRRARGEPGGIVAVARVCQEHRAAVELDLRRIGVALTDAGTDRLRWGEVARILPLLAADTGTNLCASVNGWDRPATPEFRAVADLFDLTVGINRDRKKRAPAPYPRPWSATKRRESRNTRGKDETMAILATMKRGLTV